MTILVTVILTLLLFVIWGSIFYGIYNIGKEMLEEIYIEYKDNRNTKTKQNN